VGMQHNRLRLYGHVLKKDDGDGVKRYGDVCMLLNLQAGQR